MTEVEKLQAHVNLLRRLLKETRQIANFGGRRDLLCEIGVALEDTRPTEGRGLRPPREETPNRRKRVMRLGAPKRRSTNIK